MNFSILNIQVYATEEEFIEEKTQISKEKIQYKKYSKDGQYSLEGVLLNGIAEYSPEKGEFKSVTYVNNVLNGPAEYGWEEGIENYFYVNGILNGPARSIDFEGTIEDFKYINGSKEGLVQRSSPYNGSYEFSYKDNLLDNGIFE